MLLSPAVALAATLLITSPGPASQLSDPPEPLARIVLDLDAPRGATFEDFARLGLDVVELDLGSGRAVVLAPPRDLAELDAAQIPYVVEHPDEQARYAARYAETQTQVGGPALGAWLNPPFASGGMGGFWTFTEIVSVLDQIHAAYPNLTTDKFSIGQTVEGRQIWCIKVSDNPDVDEDEPEARFDSMHHSREPQGMQTSFWFLLHCLESYGTDPLATYLVDERELFFVPVVNPDGYVYNQQIEPDGGGLWRKNRRDNGDGTTGVDLNRNYPFQWGFDNFGSSPFTDAVTYRGPSPASEPETQAMIAFIQSREFATSLSIHTFSDVWIQPFGYDFGVLPQNQSEYDELNELCTEVNGYGAGTPIETLGTLANGSTIDWEADATGAITWTPEIGSASDGFWPETERIVPLAEANLLAFQRVGLAAGPFVYATDLSLTEIGDGDGFTEGGESVEFVIEARNAGRQATSGPVTATLVIESGGATIVAGQADLGLLGSFAGTDNASSPLSLQIDADADPGSLIAWRVVLDGDGLLQDLTGSFSVGEPRTLIADDVEVPRGWTIGVAGDTAATGLWERGDPIGTTSSGEPSNPDDDTTVGGQLAFVTGNGGGSAGNDDVDDGRTTLVTPRIDLSGVDAARVAYQRWFANLSVVDDAFAVELSNDDGQTWVELETVTGNQNQWLEFEADLQSLLPLTNAVRVRFVAEDDPNNSLVEAGVDDLRLDVFGDGPLLALYGSPEVGGTLRLFSSVETDSQLVTLASLGTTQLTLPGVEGELLIDPTSAIELSSLSLAAGGPSEQAFALPANPSLIGTDLFLQAAAFSSQGVALSNRTVITFE